MVDAEVIKQTVTQAVVEQAKAIRLTISTWGRGQNVHADQASTPKSRQLRPEPSLR